MSSYILTLQSVYISQHRNQSIFQRRDQSIFQHSRLVNQHFYIVIILYYYIIINYVRLHIVLSLYQYITISLRIVNNNQFVLPQSNRLYYFIVTGICFSRIYTCKSGSLLLYKYT